MTHLPQKPLLPSPHVLLNLRHGHYIMSIPMLKPKQQLASVLLKSPPSLASYDVRNADSARAR